MSQGRDDTLSEKGMDSAKEIYQQTLNAYRGEYEQLLAAWRDIERKAQGAIATSGIFFAGVFAFIRQIAVPLDGFQKMIITLTILLLFLSIICAIHALILRNIKAPPNYRIVEHLVNGLKALDPKEYFGRLPGFYYEMALQWPSAIQSITKGIEEKNESLKNSQELLVGALFFSLILTILKIFSS